MVVMQVLDVMSAPVLGMFTGHTGNQAVFDRLNAQWSEAAGVMFGTGPSALGARYDAFTKKIRSLDDQSAAAISRASIAVLHPDRITLIDSPEMLENVPACMQIGILTMPRVRELLNEGLIYGWGIEPEHLPEEDVVGRLVENGTWRYNDPRHPDPEHIEQGLLKYEYRSDDPMYTVDELRILRSSRDWVDDFLTEQLCDEEGGMDITDLPNRMGKLR